MCSAHDEGTNEMQLQFQPNPFEFIHFRLVQNRLEHIFFILLNAQKHVNGRPHEIAKLAFNRKYLFITTFILFIMTFCTEERLLYKSSEM